MLQAREVPGASLSYHKVRKLVLYIAIILPSEVMPEVAVLHLIHHFARLLLRSPLTSDDVTDVERLIIGHHQFKRPAKAQETLIGAVMGSPSCQDGTSDRKNWAIVGDLDFANLGQNKSLASQPRN